MKANWPLASFSTNASTCLITSYEGHWASRCKKPRFSSAPSARRNQLVGVAVCDPPLAVLKSVDLGAAGGRALWPAAPWPVVGDTGRPISLDVHSPAQDAIAAEAGRFLSAPRKRPGQSGNKPGR